VARAKDDQSSRVGKVEKTELDDFRMLHGVAPAFRLHLWKTGRHLRAAPGEALIRQGTESATMFFLLSGELSVTLGDPTSDAIATVQAGETVGELGVLDGAVASANVVAKAECRLLALDEEGFWHLLHASHPFAVNLLVKVSERLRSTNRAVTSNMEKRRLYERAAMFDGLTGIHNRRWLDDTLHRLVERYEKAGSALSIALIDIDHFKDFNDGHGHEAGDAVLTAVAANMAAHLRPTDLVARFGGEEFVLLLPDTATAEAADAAERLRQVVSETEVTMPDGRRLPPVTISAGVAELRTGQKPAELLKRADVAMYRAKQSGRNRVVVDEGSKSHGDAEANRDQ
jgi:diguanylate cyclase (GGDEF)-like protein